MEDTTRQAHPPRPSNSDGVLDRLIAEALLPRVLKWFGAKGNTEIDEEGEREEILDQLTEAVGSALVDGYELAKFLDYHSGWEPDHELVEILDRVALERTRLLEKLVEEWVTIHSVRPKYSVGQRVTFKRSRWDEERVEGEVTAVKEGTAQYLVFCESLGHVREGCGVHGIYVPFENAEEA